MIENHEINNLQNKSFGIQIAISLVIGLSFAHFTFSPSYLIGKKPAWEMRLNDPSTYLTGLRFYIRDDWRFPIFNAENMNYPEGTNIIYTDSIPLMAFFAKILYKITGMEYNYFGNWIYLNFIMYGVSFLFLLRSLKIYSLKINLIILLAAYGMFPMYSVMLREHISLSSHFVIPLGLGLYFYSYRLSLTKVIISWII